MTPLTALLVYTAVVAVFLGLCGAALALGGSSLSRHDSSPPHRETF